jgi:hypothetical protein
MVFDFMKRIRMIVNYSLNHNFGNSFMVFKADSLFWYHSSNCNDSALVLIQTPYFFEALISVLTDLFGLNYT